MMMRIGPSILAALLVGSFAFAPAAHATNAYDVLSEIQETQGDLTEPHAEQLVNALGLEGDTIIKDITHRFADFGWDQAFRIAGITYRDRDGEDVTGRMVLLQKGSAMILVLDAQFHPSKLWGFASSSGFGGGLAKLGPTVLVVNPAMDEISLSEANMPTGWHGVVEQVGGFSTDEPAALKAKTTAKDPVSTILDKANYPESWWLQVEGEGTALTVEIQSADTWNDAFGVNGMTLYQPVFGIKLRSNAFDFLYRGTGTYRNEDFALRFAIPSDKNPLRASLAFSSRKLGLGSVFKLMAQWNNRFPLLDSHGAAFNNLLAPLEEAGLFDGLDEFAKLRNDSYESTASVANDDGLNPEDFTVWYQGPLADGYFGVMDTGGLYINGMLKILGKEFSGVNSTVDRSGVTIEADLDATISPDDLLGIGEAFGDVGVDGSFGLLLNSSEFQLNLDYYLRAGAIGARRVTVEYDESNGELKLFSPPTCLTPYEVNGAIPLTVNGLPGNFDDLLATVGTVTPAPGYLLDCGMDVIEGPASEVGGEVENAAEDVMDWAEQAAADAGEVGEDFLCWGFGIHCGEPDPPAPPDHVSVSWTAPFGDHRRAVDIGANRHGAAIAVKPNGHVFRIKRNGENEGIIDSPSGRKIVRIDLHKGGTAVAVAKDRTLWHLDNNDNWTKIQRRKGTDVGINGNYIWITGVEPKRKGYKLWTAAYSTDGNFDWIGRGPGNDGMVRIDAAPNGRAWGIDENLKLWFILQNGQADDPYGDIVATDVAVSHFGVGQVWVIDQNIDRSGGGQLYSRRPWDLYDGSPPGGWTKYQGRLRAISIGGKGRMFGANKDEVVKIGTLPKNTHKDEDNDWYY